MPDTGIKTEMDAIAVIVAALEPLDEAARQRVLNYAVGHLGLQCGELNSSVLPPAPRAPHEASEAPPPAAGARTPVVSDIRTLKEEKGPTSAIQMAAVVAYYLAELAPHHDRKDRIATADLERYFKQANYPLPTTPGQTLRDAKAAGYLDSVERGQYRLNAVGHNLVVHRLPVKGASPRAPIVRKKAAPAKQQTKDAPPAKPKGRK